MKVQIFPENQKLGHAPPSPTKQMTSALSAHHGDNAATGTSTFSPAFHAKPSLTTASYRDDGDESAGSGYSHSIQRHPMRKQRAYASSEDSLEN